MKRIRLRIILAIGCLVVVFTTALLYRAHIQTIAHVDHLFNQQLDMALDFDLSIRQYVNDKIRPLMFEVLPGDRFIPYAMSTSYVSREIFKGVREQHPNVTIKFSSENPRNPLNIAGPDEVELIRYLNENPTIHSVKRTIVLNGIQYMARAYAMRMSEDCLKCHGDPADAPKELIKLYGSEKSFHLPMGKVVGLDTVAIPVSEMKSVIAGESIKNLTVIFAGVAALFAAIVLVLGFMASDRKVMASALTRSQIEKETIMNSITDPTAYFQSADLVISWANASALKALGISNDQLSGVKCHKASWGIDEPCEYCPVLKTFQTGDRHAVEIVAPDGTYRHLKSFPVKDEKGRLLGVIEIANDITTIKQAEIRIAQSEEKYRTILETIEDGYYEVDLAGNMGFCNDSMCRILGYSRSELTGMNNRNFMGDDTAKAVYQAFNRVFSTGESTKGFDISVIQKSGIKRYINISITLMRDKDGNPSGFRGIARDVTEHLLAEQSLAVSEEKFRVLAETSVDAIYQINKNGNIIYASPSAEEITGYAPEEQIGAHYTKYLPTSQLPMAVEWFQKILSGETIRSQELISNRKDGRQIHSEISYAPMWQNNQIVGIQGTMRDLTERIKARNALKSSEERYRHLFLNAPIGITHYDQNGMVTGLNPKALEILDTTVGQGIGFNLLHKEQNEGVFKAVSESLSGNYGYYEGEFTSSLSGRHFFMRSHFNPIFSDQNQVVGGICMMEDVTQEFQALKALAESEEKFRLLAESSSDGIFQMDLNGIFTYVSPAFTETYQYAADEIVGTYYLNFIVGHKHTEVQELFDKLLVKEKIKSQDSTIIRKDGREVEINVSSAPIIKDGRVAAIQGVIRDITDQKKAEMALQESEERYRLIFNSAPVGITQFDNNSVVTAINPKALLMAGLKEQEVLGFNFSEKIQDDRMLSSVKMALDGSTASFQGEYKSTISGNTLYLDLFTAPIIAADNRINGGIMMIRDISQQTIAQMELKESQQNLESLFDAITESVLLVDPEGVILALNKTVSQRLGGIGDQMVGKNAFDFLEEDVAKFRKAKLTEVAQTGKPFTFEDIRYGRHVCTNYYPICDDHGQVNRIAVFTMDVHDRKAAEQELAKFKRISDMANYGTAILNMDGRIIYVNQTFAGLHGYNLDELVDQNLTIFHTEDQMIHVKDMRKRLFKEIGVVGEEVWHKKKDGTLFPMLMNAFVMKNETGEPEFLTVTAIDVTAMKRAEEALRESEEKYRLIFDSSPLGIFHYDANGVVTKCNPKILELSGASNDKLVGFDLINGVKNELFLNAIRNSLAGVPGELEGKYLSVTGCKESYLRAFTVPIRDIQNAVIGGICVAEDISEKVLFEKALEESEKRYRLLFESAPVAIAVSDLEGNLKDFNTYLLETFGYSSYEAWSLNFRDIYVNYEDQNKLWKELDDFGKLVNREVEFKQKNGDRIYILLNMNIIKLEGQKFILGIYRDITHIRKAEQELKTSHEKLRNLTKYLQSARENERTSIARELHDELGQVLTAINMEASWVAQKIPETLNTLKPRAEAISDLSVGAIGAVKRIISELRPTLLTDLGLAAAIKWQAEDYQQRIGIRFEVDIDPEEIVLDDELGIAIFRIFQEATTNVIRHAQATAVSVSLMEHQTGIELVVKDNGIGITEDKLELNESFGILGMRERTEVFGGSLEVSGIPGKGTTLRAKFPT